MKNWPINCMLTTLIVAGSNMFIGYINAQEAISNPTSLEVQNAYPQNNTNSHLQSPIIDVENEDVVCDLISSVTLISSGKKEITTSKYWLNPKNKKGFLLYIPGINGLTEEDDPELNLTELIKLAKALNLSMLAVDIYGYKVFNAGSIDLTSPFSIFQNFRSLYCMFVHVAHIRNNPFYMIERTKDVISLLEETVLQKEGYSLGPLEIVCTSFGGHVGQGLIRDGDFRNKISGATLVVPLLLDTPLEERPSFPIRLVMSGREDVVRPWGILFGALGSRDYMSSIEKELKKYEKVNAQYIALIYGGNTHEQLSRFFYRKDIMLAFLKNTEFYQDHNSNGKDNINNDIILENILVNDK